MEKDNKGSGCGLFQLNNQTVIDCTHIPIINNQTFAKKTEGIQGTLVGILVLRKLAQSNRTMGQNLSTGRNMILLKDLSPHANYHRLKMHSLLGYDAVLNVKFLALFWRIVLSPSSG